MDNITEKDKYSTVILAAGKSSRMKFPKAFLKWNKDLSFLEYLCSIYSNAGCKQIIVVLNQEGEKYFSENNYLLADNCKIVINTKVEFGRFYSLRQGLMSLAKNQAVFVQNIDNPFINENLLNKMINNCPRDGYSVAGFKGKRGHPIFLSKKTIFDIISETNNETNLRRFLSAFPAKIINSDDERVLLNINNNEEYREWFGKNF
ncbi:MAG: NTP transferase domain-containing protein [Bacteroidales bacterium]|nr:NTP transferase domain-containing protein [Bacteroidales bacterium]